MKLENEENMLRQAGHYDTILDIHSLIGANMMRNPKGYLMGVCAVLGAAAQLEAIPPPGILYPTNTRLSVTVNHTLA